MTNDEKLTPEEEDGRNQAMLQDLRYMHSPVTKAQSLECVRNRLLATQHTSTLNSMEVSRHFMHKTKQGRIQSMNDMPISITHKKGYYLNMLAAGVIAALLIGSLLFAVTRVYQSNTGGGGPAAPTPPASMPTCAPGPKPTVVPGPKPTVVPGPKPTVSPVSNPTPFPTVVPGPKPTVVPGPKPTPFPTVVPGPKPPVPPVSKPTPFPTVTPSH